MSKKPEQPAAPPNPLQEDPRVVEDKHEFPEPSLYFKVFDSEKDEPEAKIRSDVNKLYDRWQEKYGRRWPEDGLNTEDIVWLQEEAYKPKAGTKAATGAGVYSSRIVSGGEASVPGKARPSRKSLGFVDLEKTEYEDEFIPDTEEEAAAAEKREGKKIPKDRIGRMSNYDATVAGGKWVTDEFESQDYEAGNLEQLWGMYLWDKEGKTTLMPTGLPNEMEGEESEEFDDYYTAWRPRHIDSDDAREAVWVTDEFESDEDNTEDEWEPEYVGAGLGLKAEDPLNPQYSLRHSNHPLAPFPGEALKWSSYVYPDHTTYEGLTKQSIPHGMGVMVFGTGTGAGFSMKETRAGDKYEGEFQAGYAHGLGQFTSETTGEVFIGEFFAGQKHGCGIKMDMRPFFQRLELGEDPIAAYKATWDGIMRNIEFRTWYRNTPLGDAGEDEVIMVNVLRDELENPVRSVLKNKQHDLKLKAWARSSDHEKAMNRMLAIIDNVAATRSSGPSYYRDTRGRLRAAVNEEGADTDYDSVDIMVGNESNGEFGFGWDGNTDSELNPMEPRLAEQLAAEGQDDILEDLNFKKTVLGGKIVNPLTGLDLNTYLAGKEGHHKELVQKAGSRMKPEDFNPAFQQLAREMGAGKIKDLEDSSYVEEEEDPLLAAATASGIVAASDVMRVAADMARWDALLANDEPLIANRRPVIREGKNYLAAEDTDTRFETESDMMVMCDLAEILGTVEEAREIVNRARMWRWKPYGEVTIRFAQDANGAPVQLFQDPLHYPHGTKFMAPGPMGQCHPVPDDVAVRVEMQKVAHNFERIHSMYNFDWDPAPGTIQYKIDQRIKRAEELKDNQLARYLEAAEEELAAAAAEAQQGGEQLMLADASHAAASASGRGLGLGGGPTAFASMTMSHSAFAASGRKALSFGMGVSKAVLGTLADAARSVPLARPRLVRPSSQQQRGRQQQQQVL